jgi:hypothetical protein
MIKYKTESGWVEIPTIKGDKGDPGESGIYMGDKAPINNDINVWIDTSENIETENFIYTPNKAEKNQFLMVSDIDDNNFPIEWKTSNIITKTDEMTNPVGVDELGALWSAGLSSTQISALDGLLRVAQYKEDVTYKYNVFRVAFGLDAVEKPTVVYSTGLVDRTISGDYVNDRVTTAGRGAFTGCVNLRKLSLTKVTDLPFGVFNGYYGPLSRLQLETLNLPNLGNLKYYVMHSTSIANPLVFTSPITIGREALAGFTCPKVVFLETMTWEQGMFNKCAIDKFEYHKLQTIPLSTPVRYVILRTTDGVCPTNLINIPSHTNIYVPAALVDSYKTATNWSSAADRIYAIEDHPDICE